MPQGYLQIQFSGDLHELNTGVVYFDQRLGAAQKHFQLFLSLKAKKMQKKKEFAAKFSKKSFFLFAPKCWSKVLFPKNIED